MSDFLTRNDETRFNIEYAARQLMSAECVLDDVAHDLRELGADAEEVETIEALRARLAAITAELVKTQRLDEDNTQ